MIRNGKYIGYGTVISTQVCVIGSGPAGITAAWYLQNAGIKVTLIEGSRASNLNASREDKRFLYDGTADGLFASNECEFLLLPYPEARYPVALERERFYGGTSNHWGGQCRPLDPITFKGERPGFPEWPIKRPDLDPYYAQAASFLNLHGDDFTAEYWQKIVGGEVPKLDGFCAEMYQFIPNRQRNFAERAYDGKTIRQSPVDVILNATLLEIDHSDGHVNGLRVASMDDKQQPQAKTHFTIEAEAYVLACGAVANARQLLLSNAGNEHDQVGRYFMCHPLAPGSSAGYPDPVTITTPFLSSDQQNLMDGGGWHDPKTRVNVEGRFSLTEEAQRTFGIGSCWFWAGGGPYLFEMAPNGDSRVTLDNATDPVFGQKQTKITWELSETDKKTFDHSTALFKNAAEKKNGEVSFLSWEDVKKQLVVNGHHIGTTRMSSDPEKGVVDKNLKVHSLNNLYVAGSSVFATAGISNPTFTIVALSIRLAEHLSEKLSGLTTKRGA